jgi:hypothetical protein
VSVGTVILLGLGSKDLLVTLGYGAGAEEPALPVVPSRDHWGHWPLVRRRLSTSSSAYSEAVAEEIIEEVEEELQQAEITFRSLPANWTKVLDDALQKVQAKIKAETIFDLPARKEERRKAAQAARKELERLEEEELMQMFLMIDN